jgi:hypothetical protein
MKTTYTGIFLLSLLLSIPALAARPDTKREAKHELKPEVKPEVKQYSGFLGDYSQLKPGPESGAAKVYIKQGVDFKQYRKVIMDHVIFYFKEDAENKGIDTVEFTELSAKFHQAVVDALGTAYILTGKPGAGVLRVRVALTDVQLPAKPLSSITAILPAAFIITTVKSGVAGEDTELGDISMEFELLDSATNQRIGAVIERKAGGTSDSTSTFGKKEDTFTFWAQRLRKRLDTLYGK